ncbi:hemolysin D [Camelimonas fluminis]|uniref:Efflux RND transporter periplasmic adaptor subunit n=1 Tax=Camelimonas fluminis TaxID=1576911 RepID=A0ABV7UH76_9HYPH|nr:efflux RND transporter periplasmic adaptor subunit [Camelimonas fluminis]GHE63334.1 hemolysin D [Camelimonas fluminis]
MRLRPVVIALAIAAVAGGGWYYARHQGGAGKADGKTTESRGQAGRPGVAVITAAATSETFPVRRRAIGVIETPASVVVRSRIASQILEQHIRDGQMVKAGDPLFTLDDKEARAAVARDEAAVARDTALLARANADQERVKQLAARNTAAQSQVDLAVANARSAAAALAGSQAALAASKLQLSYTKIDAPMAGRIGAVRVPPGNLVGAGDLSGLGLVTITQIQPVRVTFTLPERDLGALRGAMLRQAPTVRVMSPNSGEELASSIVDFVDNAVDTGSGTIVARATFPNGDLRLWPGMFVDVAMDLDQRRDTTIVPTVAVQQGQDSPFVYVVGKDGKVDSRPVKVFAALEGRTAIASGVSPGEHVIIEGQQRVGPGVRVNETLRPPDKNAEKEDMARTGAPRARPEKGNPT